MASHSNFAFIEGEWPQIHGASSRAEEYVHTDPQAASFYARYAIEQLLDYIYQLDRLEDPYRRDLSARIHHPDFQDQTPKAVLDKLDLIRRVGNKAAHDAQSIQTRTALQVVKDLHHVLIWAAQLYSTHGAEIDVHVAFDPEIPARRAPMRHEDLQKLALRVQEDEKAYRRRLQESQAKAQSLEEELERVRAELATAQQARTVETSRDFQESETRDKLIDQLLAEAGWRVTSASSPRQAEPEVPLQDAEGTTRYADYVLWNEDGSPLAVVEAKRTRRSAQDGQEQARLYADALEARHGQRPIIFCTNGYETWIWEDAAFALDGGRISAATSSDAPGYAPRPIHSFLTQDELARRVQARRRRRPLVETSVKEEIVERGYQQRAISSVDETFAGKRRAALLVMATGTGKTRTVIALVDQMLRAGWITRVLFLADRVSLVNQAVNAFKTHLPEEPPVNLVEEKTGEGRIFVSTYPTMLNQIDEYEADGSRRFSPGFFDLVIVDEAHRSVYQKYRSIFEWFDSLLLGLTATPVDQVDRNTFLLFEQEPGVPTEIYPLDQAIRDEYLVPPRARRLGTEFLSRGIRYDDLSDDEKLEWDALEWDDDGEIPDAVSSAEINKRLFNEDTVDKVLSQLMEEGIRVGGGDRLGKTIIFAKNQAHAEFIHRRFDAQHPELGGTFARVITNQTEHNQRLIDAFGRTDSEPQIAISVDMLDTGIDIPDVVNLVFFKQVFSRTKFWQMVGRGTRRRPNLFGPGEDKTEFLLLDFCNNLEFFNADVPEAELARPQSLGERLLRRRLELLTALPGAEGGAVDPSVVGERAVVAGSEYDPDRLQADLAHIARLHVTGLNPDNVQVRPHRRLVEKYSSPEAWQQLTATEAEEIAEHLGRLPSSALRDAEEAKSFDLTVLQAQLARVTGDARQLSTQQRRVQEIAQGLLMKTNVPDVAAQSALIQEIAEDAWWEDVTVLMLENVRRSLRQLAQYVDKTRWKPVITDFEDELAEGADVELRPSTPGTDVGRFRQKAERFLRQHLDALVVEKLRHNRQLTEQDLESLQQLLIDADVGTREDIDSAAEQAQGLGLFVRSLVGLDRAAAQEAFSAFTAGATFSSDQLRFIERIVEYLTANGAMSPKALFESPVSDEGTPDEVLGDDGMDAVVDILAEIRRRAEPTSEVAAGAPGEAGTPGGAEAG